MKTEPVYDCSACGSPMVETGKYTPRFLGGGARVERTLWCCPTCKRETETFESRKP